MLVKTSRQLVRFKATKEGLRSNKSHVGYTGEAPRFQEVEVDHIVMESLMYFVAP